MPRQNHILESFAAGEISPRMWGRVSTTGYKQGLAECTNMIPDVRGPVISRGGTRHFYSLPGYSEANLYDFRTPELGEFVILLVDSKIQVLDASDIYTILPTAAADLVAPYLEADLKEVHAYMTPNANSMYFCHKDHEPHKLEWSGTAWTFAAVVFTAPPVEWVANNYPGCMTFFQGRSWWAGTPLNPETLWASKSGLYEDMTQGSLADDGLEFTIDSHGLIKWLDGSKNLLIGTDEKEFIATADAGVITPDDIQIEQQSAYGSKNVKPANLGPETLYVSPDGRKLRAMWYSWTESGWVSQDLSEASEHITADRIREIAFCRNPDSIAWMVTEPGGFLGCSYRRTGSEKPVIGWHKHIFNENAEVRAVTSLEQTGDSLAFLAVHRTVDAVENIYVEWVEQDSTVSMDDYTEVVLPTPGTVVTGLGHLEGIDCQVVADGAVFPNAVVTGGQITLPADATTVDVGISLDPEVKTLPLALPDARGGGTIHTLKRWNKAIVRVYNSAKPLINGERPPERHPATLQGQPEPPATENVTVTTLGATDSAQITISQDLPLPLTVINITGEVSSEQL